MMIRKVINWTGHVGFLSTSSGRWQIVFADVVVLLLTLASVVYAVPMFGRRLGRSDSLNGATLNAPSFWTRLRMSFRASFRLARRPFVHLRRSAEADVAKTPTPAKWPWAGLVLANSVPVPVASAG